MQTNYMRFDWQKLRIQIWDTRYDKQSIVKRSMNKSEVFFVVALIMMFSCRYDSLYLVVFLINFFLQCVFRSTDTSFIMQIMLHLITFLDIGRWMMLVGSSFLIQVRRGMLFCWRWYEIWGFSPQGLWRLQD